MKKALLACSIIVSSCFFSYAQVQVGGVQVGTNGVQVGTNGINVGQVMVSDGKGTGIQYNGITGQTSGQLTVGGIRLGFGTGGFYNSQGGVLGILSLAQYIVTLLVPFLIGVAVLAFFWFIIEFILKGKDDPSEQQKAKAGMFWSILALFVMVSIWGIISLMGSTLGIGQGGSIQGFSLPGQ